MMNLSKFKALLIIAVVFLLGAVAGASLSRTVLRSISAWGPHHHSRGPFIERLQQTARPFGRAEDADSNHPG